MKNLLGFRPHSRSALIRAIKQQPFRPKRVGFDQVTNRSPNQAYCSRNPLSKLEEALKVL